MAGSVCRDDADVIQANGHLLGYDQPGPAGCRYKGPWDLHDPVHELGTLYCLLCFYS